MLTIGSQEIGGFGLIVLGLLALGVVLAVLFAVASVVGVLLKGAGKGWKASRAGESREELQAAQAASREERKAKRDADWAEHKQRQAEKVERMRGTRP